MGRFTISPAVLVLAFAAQTLARFPHIWNYGGDEYDYGDIRPIPLPSYVTLSGRSSLPSMIGFPSEGHYAGDPCGPGSLMLCLTVPSAPRPHPPSFSHPCGDAFGGLLIGCGSLAPAGRWPSTRPKRPVPGSSSGLLSGRAAFYRPKCWGYDRCPRGQNHLNGCPCWKSF